MVKKNVVEEIKYKSGRILRIIDGEYIIGAGGACKEKSCKGIVLEGGYWVERCVLNGCDKFKGFIDSIDDIDISNLSHFYFRDASYIPGAIEDIDYKTGEWSKTYREGDLVLGNVNIGYCGYCDRDKVRNDYDGREYMVFYVAEFPIADNSDSEIIGEISSHELLVRIYYGNEDVSRIIIYYDEDYIYLINGTKRLVVLEEEKGTYGEGYSYTSLSIICTQIIKDKIIRIKRRRVT